MLPRGEAWGPNKKSTIIIKSTIPLGFTDEMRSIFDKKDIIYENDYAYVSYDSYPVSKFHSLIIPKRHISDFFDLNKDELFACYDVIHKIKKEIEKKDKLVKGFNIGTNAGLISGQTIMHCHSIISLLSRFSFWNLNQI